MNNCRIVFVALTLASVFAFVTGCVTPAEQKFSRYMKSAEQGDAVAQLILGDCYWYGYVVKEDESKGVEWYRKSAEQGNAKAQYKLGYCYDKGLGVEKDALKAVGWYMKSAEQGNADAKSALEKNASKVFEWYMKSAEQGDASAQLELGDCYMKGQGVAKDASKAVEWWRKSAEQGNADAQCYLGDCYVYGQGVSKDKDMAKSWFEKAAAQGHREAFVKLEDLSKSIWEASSRQMVECEERWKAMPISLQKLVLDRKKSLEDIVKECSCTDEGKAIVEAFGEEFLPNAFGNYEKTRDKATELLQTMKETFPSPVPKGAGNHATYSKVLSRVCESQVNLLRARRELAHFFLLHKAGVITNDELAKVDKEKMRVLIRFKAGEAFPLSGARELNGNAAEFAEKFMPDSYKLFQTFIKEHGQLEGLYKELFADAEKMNACYYDWLFTACCQKSSGLTQRTDALAKTFTELYMLHKVGDVDADGLSKRDAEMSASMKAFADSLPGFLRENAASPFANLFEMVPIPGKNYSICKYEVTQLQWVAVMGDNPSEFSGAADLPVENISWDDCQKFIEKLNAMPEVKMAGVVYHLPTGDEWEYACRAGSTGKYGLLADGKKGTLDEMGWYRGNSGDKTHPVGQKKPNAFGLYDMHGNVCELTSTAGGDDRVRRCGGSWDDWYCVADVRYSCYPDSRSDRLGFRLASGGATKEE